MQLPLYLKWNHARNRRSLFGLYIALTLVAVLAIWSLPKLISASVFCLAFLLDPEHRPAILQGMGRALLAIGVVAAIGGGAFAFWHFMTHHVWQIPKRYAKAIEQLEAEILEHRLESLQTLKRIARLTLRKQVTITRKLATFVQEKASIYSRNAIGSVQEFHPVQESQTIAADIQAALTIIGRKSLICRMTWRLIRKVYSAEEKQLNMGLTNLSKARLPYANLQAANLYGSNLQKADLQNINLQKATLQKANLKACNLHRANLQEAELQNSNLQEATLHSANLQGANLYSANLQGTNLYSANLQNASLQAANLQEANLYKANLQGAFLYGANLQNASLQSVNLQEAFLPEANLQGANLYKANLQDVTGLTDEQFMQAKLCMTILPDGSLSDRDCAELGLCQRPRSVQPVQETTPPQPSPC